MAQMKFLDKNGLLHLLGKISAWASDTFLKGVKMNGATKARTNGVVDLGTVLTEHQSIRTINGQSLVGEGDLTFQEGLRQVSKSELDGVMMRGIYELIGQIGNDNTEASSLLLVEGSLMGGASQYVIERDGTTHLRHKSPNGSWSDWDRFDRGTLLVHVSHGELAVGEPIDFGLREGQVFEELEDHINLVVICVDDMDLYLFPTIVDFSDDRVEFQSNVMYNNETGTYGTYILGMTLNYPNLIHDEFIFEDIRLSRLKDDSGHRTVSDAEKTAWNGKQAALVSGTNIKTINGESLLGSGDLTIHGLETVDSRNLDSVTAEGIYRASYSGYSELLVVSSIDGGSSGLQVRQTKISAGGSINVRMYYNGSWQAWYNPLEADDDPEPGSGNLVTSGGVYEALQNKADKGVAIVLASVSGTNKYLDSDPYDDLKAASDAGKAVILRVSISAITSRIDIPIYADGDAFTGNTTYKNSLTFYVDVTVRSGYSSITYDEVTVRKDNVPMENSGNAVRSGGVYAALEGKAPAMHLITDAIPYDIILQPNTVYDFGITDNVRIGGLAAGDDDMDIYHFFFTAASTDLTVSFPESIVLANEYSWDIAAGRRYEVSIMDGVALVSFADVGLPPEDATSEGPDD